MSKPTKTPPPEKPIDRRPTLLVTTMLTPLRGQTRGGLCDSLLASLAAR